MSRHDPHQSAMGMAHAMRSQPHYEQPTPLSRVEDAACREALERIGESRRQLRMAGRTGEDTHAGGENSDAKTSFTDLLGVGLRHWVADKPWYAQVHALGEVTKVSLFPWVKRNPLASLAIASTAGALLVAAKPWRWAWLSRHSKAVPSIATAWITRELSSPVTQAALMTSLAGLIGQWIGSREQSQAEAEEEPQGNDGRQDGPLQSNQPTMSRSDAANDCASDSFEHQPMDIGREPVLQRSVHHGA